MHMLTLSMFSIQQYFVYDEKMMKSEYMVLLFIASMQTHRAFANDV